MPAFENPTLRLVAYYRTTSQPGGVAIPNLDKQRAAVAAYGWFRRSEIVSEFTEIETVGVETRPQLTLAIFEAHRLGANLLVADFSTLLLNIRFVSQLAEAEKNQNVRVLACGLGEGEYLPLPFMLGAAKFEARSRSESTKVGLEAAKARGVKLGSTGAEHARTAAIANMAVAAGRRSKTHSIISKLRRQQKLTTLQGIADALNARGITTPRGGMWGPTQVRRVVGRLEKDNSSLVETAVASENLSAPIDNAGSKILH